MPRRLEILERLVEDEPVMGRDGGRSRTSVRTTVARALALAGTVVLVVAMSIAAEPSDAESAPLAGSTPGLARTTARPGTDGTLVLRVAFDAEGRGSFIATGAVSDSGVGKARRSLANQRLRLVETLTGSAGTLVVRVEQKCGSGKSTWRVMRGSGNYANITGGGTGTGGISCGEPAKAFRAVYRGTVAVADEQPRGVPGPYGGWTAQGERVTFDVLAGGGSVGSIRVERLTATCTPPLEVSIEPAFLSTYPIAADGSFTATFGNSTITGRFGGAGATGTITFSSTVTPPYTCSSGSVGWSASSPPPPLPTALPGTYCGSTTQSRGACLTLSPGGRVTYLRFEARLDCVLPEQAQFEIELGFSGAGVPLRSNLGFEVIGALEGDAAGEYVVRGTFDSTGRASGTLTLHRTSFDDQEGRIYTCKDMSVSWQAARPK